MNLIFKRYAMKKNYLYISCLLAVCFFAGCKKEGNYPGGTVSAYISLFDIRDLYKGKDVTLSKENMFGADKIAGVVISDHSGGNLPAGLLIVQDSRRLGQLRGISIPVGADAAKYVPGDSVIISVEGSVLKRVDGILQVTGLSNDKITKLASVGPLTPLVVKSNLVLTSPDMYESTLVTVTKAGFDPALPPGSTYAGDRIINDGFGNLTLHTEPTASWANKILPFSSNLTGIVLNSADGKPRLWPRKESDIFILSATAPKIAPIIITGFLTDPPNSPTSDANYEYIQLLATKNIDFAVTPFSVVTTNNAGANTPTGFPVNGWATGDLRTYKFNITSGTVSAGQYFYIGANRNIWGLGSTDISSAKWFGKMYSTVGGDGFGAATTNLLANSGNGAGIAVFDKTAVDASTIPVDVIFYGGAGMLYAAPSSGYRITNTDYYDEKNPTTLADQPYFTQGSNTGKFAFPTVISNVGGRFASLGGRYNKTTGRWTNARVLTNVVLTTTSQLADIETGGTVVEQ
jgi:hypothetical protein